MNALIKSILRAAMLVLLPFFAGSAALSQTLGSSSAYPGLSAAHIKNNVPSAIDGMYWIDPDGATGALPFQAYCDMTTDGGGWTLGLNSIVGAESQLNDIITNYGSSPTGPYTRCLIDLAVNRDAQIRHYIQCSYTTFHAKYTGRFHNNLPAFSSWTVLGGHISGADTLLAYNFGQPFVTSTYTGDYWYQNSASPNYGTVPCYSKNGYSQGPVNYNGAIINRYSIYVREISTPRIRLQKQKDSVLLADGLATNDTFPDVIVGATAANTDYSIFNSGEVGIKFSFAGSQFFSASPPEPQVIGPGESVNLTATLDTSWAGYKTGTVKVYNTTAGQWIDETFNFTATVMNHAVPTLNCPSGTYDQENGVLSIDFGAVPLGSPVAPVTCFIDNATWSPAAGLELDSFDAPSAPFSSDLATFTGPEAISAGQNRSFSITLDTSAKGSFRDRTYELRFSDTDFPGAYAPGSQVLTLKLSADVGASDVAPKIEWVVIGPQLAKAGDKLRVVAKVSDDTVVSEVKADGLALTDSGSGLWYGEFTAAGEPGWHQVTVEATDEDGHATTSTDGVYRTTESVMTSVKSALDPVAVMSVENLLFSFAGRVTPVDPDSFLLDDGSPVPVRIVASGHKYKEGDFVSARGLLDPSSDGPALYSMAERTTKMN